MFRIFVAGLIAIAAIGLAPQSQAQNTQGQEALPPLSEQHLQLARQVFIASKTGRSFDNILPNLAEQAKTNFVRSNPQIQLGVIDAVDRVALNMVPMRKELDEGLIRVWARAFTEEELKDLLQFFESPTGQKFTENYTKVISTQLALAESWTTKLSRVIAIRTERELKKMVLQDAQNLRGSTTESTGQ